LRDEREEHHGVEGPVSMNANESEMDHVDAKAEEGPTTVGMEQEKDL
jgi:hypothetical protein